MASLELGPLQLQVMEILWERAPATGREILESLNDEASLAYSTIQTVLRRLEEKGAVSHHVEGRTFVYRPLVGPEQVRQETTRDLIDRMFNGSAVGLISYLLRNERISPNKLDQVKRLIDEPADASEK